MEELQQEVLRQVRHRFLVPHGTIPDRVRHLVEEGYLGILKEGVVVYSPPPSAEDVDKGKPRDTGSAATQLLVTPATPPPRHSATTAAESTDAVPVATIAATPAAVDDHQGALAKMLHTVDIQVRVRLAGACVCVRRGVP